VVSLEELLLATSRTFALAIPLLPHPVRHEITLAYLLFRVSDTLEDAENWRRHARLEALKEWAYLLDDPDIAQAQALSRRWRIEPPSPHTGYQLLLEHLPALMASVRALPVNIREEILPRARRSAIGMRGFMSGADAKGHLWLESLEQLRDYCYVVAGMVGELISAVILSHMPHAAPPQDFWSWARDFGEALQLVNILKDADADLLEGRAYLPSNTSPRAIFELARKDLKKAEKYVAALRAMGADPGYVAFTLLPLRLAYGTLERVEMIGAGAKLSRSEVSWHLEEVQRECCGDLWEMSPCNSNIQPAAVQAH
jgi:farnesyl-diphosphate farnesyltransferase